MTAEAPLVYLFLTDPQDTLKMLRETFCASQQALGEALDNPRHIERLGRLIAEIDRQRPLGPNGKHGNLHTPFCGCEDKGSARAK